MDEFIKQLHGKNIHLIGVSGSEGSNILRYLIKNNIPNVKVHDLLIEGSIEKSFKLWHKGIEGNERESAYQQFRSDLSSLEFYTGENYLKDIDKAEIIFVPQSWRLYKENLPLLRINKKNKGIFYSLMRLYLDFAKARIVGITGTVGKGSTANILFEILKKSLPANRRVYFAGNDTWMVQAAEKLDEMTEKDLLILEISHRQLQEGFSIAPNIVVFTNLYPNHLDEVTWEQYQTLKLSLLKSQKSHDYSILNYDFLQLRQISKELNSKVSFFSAKKQELNSKFVQSIYKSLMNNKTAHYIDNILAVSTVCEILGLSNTQILSILPSIKSLPLRVEQMYNISGISFYNDIKSTTPWSTIAAVKKLHPNVILISGGRTKGIEYLEFAKHIKPYVKKLIVINSQLSTTLVKLLGEEELTVVNDLPKAIDLAYSESNHDDKILISPAAGFFYSDFIKGKNSLRKIITSLLPKERV